MTLPQITRREIDALHQITGSIEGWLHPAEQRLLCVLGKGTDGPILEFGCYKGKSTGCILYGRRLSGKANLHVVIDLFQDYADAARGDFQAQFKANVLPLCGANELTDLRISTFDAEEPLQRICEKRGLFAGIFIDACHEYDAVIKDVQLADTLLRPGGWIAFHDAMRWAGALSVLRACWNSRALDGYRFVDSVASILVLQKPPVDAPAEPWLQAAPVIRRRLWLKFPLHTLLGKGYPLLVKVLTPQGLERIKRLLRRAQ